MPSSPKVEELGERAALDALVAAVGPVAGLQVVDIGSGEGALAQEMAQAGATVTGVDPLGPAVSWTEAGAGRYRLLRTGAETLPYDDGTVDLVLFIFSLHHVPPAVLPGVLREAARVLRPDGQLYVAEPLATGPLQDVTGMYHDETAVRTEAAAILAREAGLFRDGRHLSYFNRRLYADFEDYAVKMARNMRFNGFTEAQLRAGPVRERFDAVFARTGGIFDQPVRVDMLTR